MSVLRVASSQRNSRASHSVPRYHFRQRQLDQDHQSAREHPQRLADAARYIRFSGRVTVSTEKPRSGHSLRES